MPTTNPPAPATENFVIQRGITMVEREFQYVGENDVPIDYTGTTLESQARMGFDESLFIDLEPEWVDATLGKWKFPEKDPTETFALIEGTYYYDVVIVWGDGTRDEPSLMGEVIVQPINTRP